MSINVDPVDPAVWNRVKKAFAACVSPDAEDFNLRQDPEDERRFLAEGELLRYEIDVRDTRVRLRAYLTRSDKLLLDRKFTIA